METDGTLDGDCIIGHGGCCGWQNVKDERFLSTMKKTDGWMVRLLRGTSYNSAVASATEPETDGWSVFYSRSSLAM